MAELQYSSAYKSQYYLVSEVFFNGGPQKRTYVRLFKGVYMAIQSVSKID